MAFLNYADLPGAMLNIVEMQKQISTDVIALLSITGNANAAVPFLRYSAETYPLWRTGLSSAAPQPSGIWEESDPVVVRMILEVDKVTAGYDGKAEQQLYTWVPYTLAAFRANPQLETLARPTRPRWLLESLIRLAQTRQPGNTISAAFELTLHFAVTNQERNL